ncbi:hypothetical protein RMR16_024985 (plasmid) [Agrobacterium sp. rho-13.3]|uniref:hypothetical protein n=1 Tax=Agrobacterium sp. rho-13.3 TaxID=3072980 RepID=UPI002A15FC40|nr:hypothetical protein [Agrobacterium sp. rho-13.3]MDX8310207.1 hypothetical protein [Agrobacterium sp. rho-13.3]
MIAFFIRRSRGRSRHASTPERNHLAMSGTFGLFIYSMLAGSVAGGSSTEIRYCGQLYSSGIASYVETTLQFDMLGRITGHYTFYEKNAEVAGSLTEQGKPNGTRRSLLWSDRYGQGKLVINLSKNNTVFQGKWGGLKGDVILPWTGMSCDIPSADISTKGLKKTLS